MTAGNVATKRFAGDTISDDTFAAQPNSFGTQTDLKEIVSLAFQIDADVHHLDEIGSTQEQRLIC